MPSHIDFLVIGHVTKDLLQSGGYVVGGTATYAAVTAQRLGLRVGVVTSASPDLDLPSALAGAQVAVVPSSVSTTFHNAYVNGRRVQRIHDLAKPLRPSALPEAWRSSPIVLLGPLAGELGTEWLGLFHGSLIGVVPQGWMRQWDAQGHVFPKPWSDAGQVLSAIDVLILSEDDVGRDEALMRVYAGQVALMVVTRGNRGATVHWQSSSQDLPAYEAQELDPTGAGDVFAAAFLIRFRETGDPYAAASFANCAASFSVEGEGTSTIPTRSQVEARMAHGRLRLAREQTHG